MSRQIISTKAAPQAIGPYSQAIKVGNFLFTSGQIALDNEGKMVGGNGDVAAQTRQALSNLRAIIEAAGMKLEQVVKCTCSLKNMNDFDTFNAVYAEYFSAILPARECVEAARLPKDALVEIAAICVKE